MFPPNVAPWDKPLEPIEWKTLFKQLDMVVTSASCTYLVWAPTFQHHMIMTAMREAGLQDIGNFDWIKTNSNQTGVMRYVTSQEYGVLAFKGVKSAGFHVVEREHGERRNRWQGPIVSTFSRYENKIVNVAQKPVPLAQSLFARHCPPGSTVLVIGSGSGTDVIAGLSEGLNVIGIEKDPFQFKASLVRIRGWIELQHQPKVPKKVTATQGKEKAEAAVEAEKADAEGKAEAKDGRVPLCIVCGEPEIDEYTFVKCCHCKANIHDHPACAPFQCNDCKEEPETKHFCSVKCHKIVFGKHTQVQQPIAGQEVSLF